MLDKDLNRARVMIFKNLFATNLGLYLKIGFENRWS